jgi:Predicted sugar phosphate isomerase
MLRPFYVICNKTQHSKSDTDVLIALVIGREKITGSIRMKAGTATKMVLNMICTASMIKLGKVYGNLMVDLMSVNEKLIDRGCRIISQLTNADEVTAKQALVSSSMSVKTAIVMIFHSVDFDKAKKIIEDNDGMLRKIIP